MKLNITDGGPMGDRTEPVLEDRQWMFEGLAKGQTAAVLGLERDIRLRSLSNEQVSRAWEGIIEGMLAGHGKLMQLGLDLIDVTMNPETRRLYEDLFSMVALADQYVAYNFIIKTGANLVDIEEGKLNPLGFDEGRYRELAKAAFLLVIEQGVEGSKVLALEALRNLGQHSEVREKLIEVAHNSDISELINAAGDSLRYMRERKEIEALRADRRLLLHTIFTRPTDPVRMYVEQTLDAAAIALDPKGRSKEDLEVAVKQLSTSGADPGPVAGLLDDHSLGIIRKNVANALLHAFKHNDESIADDAAEGLVRMCMHDTEGSDSVMDALRSISQRERGDDGRPSERGRRANITFMEIQERRFGKGLPPPPPPQRAKRARPQLLTH